MVGARVGVVIEWILRRDFLSGFLDSQNGAVSSPPSSGHRSPTRRCKTLCFNVTTPAAFPVRHPGPIFLCQHLVPTI